MVFVQDRPQQHFHANQAVPENQVKWTCSASTNIAQKGTWSPSTRHRVTCDLGIGMSGATSAEIIKGSCGTFNLFFFVRVQMGQPCPLSGFSASAEHLQSYFGVMMSSNPKSGTLD